MTSHEPQPMGRPGTIGRFGFMKPVTAAMSVTSAGRSRADAVDGRFELPPSDRARAASGATMPDCENVNAAKTATAYSGSNAPVDPPNTTISSALRTPRMKMPFENASRSPRKANCCGA